MGRIKSTASHPVVVLANGPFPRHAVPLNIIKSANILICCDGAADKAMENDFYPNIIIGDLDSVKSDLSVLSSKIIRIKSQDNTDLEKTLQWCVEQGINHVVVMGATGTKDDHTLANLALLKYFNTQLDIRIVTDFGTIYCVEDDKQFKTVLGQRISLIPLDRQVQITTYGMEFQLNREPVKYITQGISNNAVADTVSVTVHNGSVLVFVAHF